MKCPRRERHLVQLFGGGGDEPLVGVAEIQGGIGRQHVEVFVALHVLDPASLAGFDDHGQRMIIVSPVGLGDSEVLGGLGFLQGRGHIGGIRSLRFRLARGVGPIAAKRC